MNTVGGISGGIWLAILGYWKLVYIGIGCILGGHFLISLILAPSLIFMLPMASRRMSNSIIIAMSITILSLVYTYATMIIWTAVIFWNFTDTVRDGDLIPALLWSYAAATSSWSFLAQKDELAGNETTFVSLGFYQIGIILLMIQTYLSFYDMTPIDMIRFLSAPMVFSLFAQIIIALAEFKRLSR